MLQAALEHCFVVLGAAASRLSTRFKDAHPSVPWDELISLGKRTLEDFQHVNHTEIWRVAATVVPRMRMELSPALPEIPRARETPRHLKTKRGRLPLANTQALEAFCQEHHILKLWFFGSILREDFAGNSDVDVLVEFDPEVRLSLWGMVGIQEELAGLLGRAVDLIEWKALKNPFVRQEVFRTSRLAYAA